MARRRRRAGITLRAARRITGGVQAVATRPEKLFPNADRPFANKAGNFVNVIARDPGQYAVSDDELNMLIRRVREFRAALTLATGTKTRTPCTIGEKNAARKTAEGLLRLHANMIRANPSISRGAKAALGIRQKPTRLKARLCPKSPPVLRYLGGVDAAGSAPGRHILEYSELNASSGAKPAGAARLELFFDLVPPGESVPRNPGGPGERGWPKYLRSFSRSPIEVEYPVSASGPMLVVYWGRWASATGEVGPWSKPCVARVEGWTAKLLPQAPAPGAAGDDDARQVEARIVFIHAPHLLPAHDDREEIDAPGRTPALISESGEARMLPAA